jgi:hypothetical protein
MVDTRPMMTTKEMRAIKSCFRDVLKCKVLVSFSPPKSDPRRRPGSILVCFGRKYQSSEVRLVAIDFSFLHLCSIFSSQLYKNFGIC